MSKPSSSTRLNTEKKPFASINKLGSKHKTTYVKQEITHNEQLQNKSKEQQTCW